MIHKFWCFIFLGLTSWRKRCVASVCRICRDVCVVCIRVLDVGSVSSGGVRADADGGQDFWWQRNFNGCGEVARDCSNRRGNGDVVGSYDGRVVAWAEQMLLLWAFRNRRSSPELRRVNSDRSRDSAAPSRQNAGGHSCKPARRKAI